MSESPQAGTPEPEAAVSESAGSPVVGQDGSETAEQLRKKLEDERALRLSQQENVERANKERAELERLRQQQNQQGQDPRAALAYDLQQRAPYDPDAAAQLQLLYGQVRQEAEAQLQEQMFLNAVPREAWAQVKGLVQQSNYTLSVQDALRSVVPPKNVEMEKQMADMRAEIERLKAPVKRLGATAGAASTVPAAAASTQEDSMPFSQYKALLQAGGAAGRDARARKDAGSLSIDYSA
jgi:uncharacterized small protein (DUF1192 family)